MEAMPDAELDGVLLAAPLPDMEGFANDVDPEFNQDAKKTPVQQGASFLEHIIQKRSGVVMTHAAEERGLSAKLLSKWCSAAAELTVRSQTASWEAVLRYIGQMAGATLHPVAYIERQAYDATPLRIRVPEQHGCQEERKVKLFMIETEVAILVRRCGPPESVAPGDFLLLRLPFSHSPRVAAKGNGVCTMDALRSVLPDSASVPALFGDCKFRLVETDEDKPNLRGERLLPSCRAPGWGERNLLHCVCSAHKVHAACTKTWDEEKMANVISGMVHAFKALDDVEVLNSLRRWMKEQIRPRLRIVQGHPSSAGATDFRRHCLQYFCPKKTHPRRRSNLIELCRLLSGDWQVQGQLIHHCTACCSSPESTAMQLEELLPRTLLSLRSNGIFSKDNWLEWPQQMLLFAWASFLHGFMLEGFIAVLHGRGLDAEGVDAELPGIGVIGQAEAAPAIPDATEAARLERAKSFRIAVTFLPQPSWSKHLYILRVSLDVAVQLMRHLTHSTSSEAVVESMHALHVEGMQSFRVVTLQSQEPFLNSLRQGVRQICDPSCWQHLAETEELRSDVWRVGCRPMAVIWQLLHVRFGMWPFRMFALLSDQSERLAPAIG